jgi:hypothetical protein
MIYASLTPWTSDRNHVGRFTPGNTPSSCPRSPRRRSLWLKELEQDNNDAWLALLIPQLKQLRRIRLTWPPYGSHYVLDMLQKAAVEEELIFPYLEEAYGVWGNSADTFPSCWNSENAFPSYHMQPFFQFPSMREVCCYMMREYDNGDSSEFPKRDTLSPQCSNITDIDLQGCNSVEGMREWVQACKALKSFRFIHGSRIVSDDDSQPRKMYESLSLHKSTLKQRCQEASILCFARSSRAFTHGRKEMMGLIWPCNEGNMLIRYS